MVGENELVIVKIVLDVFNFTLVMFNTIISPMYMNYNLWPDDLRDFLHLLKLLKL